MKSNCSICPPGEHTISVRAADRNENSMTAKVTFTVGEK